MNLQDIQEVLKTGQNSPAWLASVKDWLAGESSTLMDEQLKLQTQYAGYFAAFRDTVKSDKAIHMRWRHTDEGKREMELETLQRKIKVLREAISSHLRVLSDQARNLY